MRLHVDVRDSRIEIVHHTDERGVWATRGRRVLFRPLGGDWREIARFPIVHARGDLAIRSRVASRALRLGKCNIYPTRNGRLLGIRAGTVYRFDGSDPVPLFDIRGDCVMNRAIAETPTGTLYFGEYFMNRLDRAVRIFRIDPDLERYDVAYAFDSPRILHVHAVQVDPFAEDRLWVTTGDFGGQCWLVEAGESFERVTMWGDGSQLYRMVGTIFQEDRLCWLTDSHLETNRIVSMDRATGEVTVHGERDASSWYAAHTTDGVYIATTTVEPGPAIHTRTSRLLASLDGISWETVAEFEKDALPMRLGFGALHLPSGSFPSTSFWVTGESLRGFDGIARHCTLERGAAE